MQRGKAFPTGNKDVDILFLTTIDDDRSLLNVLNTNAGTKEYSNNENLWRNRFKRLHPEEFEKVKNLLKGSWKDFSLNTIRLLDLAKGNYNVAMLLAVQKGYNDVVYYFLFKIDDDVINSAIEAAALGNQRDFVDYFLSENASISWAMKGAAKGGHRDLIDYLMDEIDLNYDWVPNFGLYGASQGGHLDLVKFFIEQGADDLTYARQYAYNNRQREVIDFLDEQRRQ